MSQKVAGTCYVACDGEQFVVQGGVEAPINDKTRETIVPGYFKETELPPYIKVTAVMVSDFPIEKVKDSTDMTVTAEFPNGKSYVLSGAYLVGDSSYVADDGTAQLNFEGKKGVWT